MKITYHEQSLRNDSPPPPLGRRHGFYLWKYPEDDYTAPRESIPLTPLHLTIGFQQEKIRPSKKKKKYPRKTGSGFEEKDPDPNCQSIK